MFPLLRKTTGKLYILSANTTSIDVRENREATSGQTFDVRLRLDDGTDTLWRGSQVECQLFVSELFYAMRDTRGCVIEEIGNLAVAIAQDARDKAEAA